MVMRFFGIFAGFFIFLFTLVLASSSTAQPLINVATAPDARSVAIGGSATVFAVFVNSGDQTATNCRIAPPFFGSPPISLAYQALDVSGNLIGAPFTPTDVPAGASQRFLVTITANAAFEGRLRLFFQCDGLVALVFEDVNDLFFTATVGTPPDLIAIFATPSGDGVFRVDTAGGIAAAGGAVINIGSGGAETPIEVTPTFGSFDGVLGATLSICETDPASGACLAAPTPTVQMSIGGAAKTFSVFVIASDNLGAPLFPEYIRVSVVFSDPAAAPDTPEGAGKSRIVAINGPIRGRGSVAFTSPAPSEASMATNPLAGSYSMRFRDMAFDPTSNFLAKGELIVREDNTAIGIWHRFNATDGNGVALGEVDQVFTLEGTFDSINSTYAGELIFVPDLQFNTPPLRGTFVANFDPGRGMRGTYGVTTPSAEKPSGGQMARPQDESDSPNIEATGMGFDRDRTCSIVNNIINKSFDVYINDVKVGSVTITLDIIGDDFTINGNITVSLNGVEESVAITGTISPPTQGFLAPTEFRTNIDLTRESPPLLFDTDFGEVTSCTANGFKVGAIDRGDSAAPDDDVSLFMEFRMP